MGFPNTPAYLDGALAKADTPNLKKQEDLQNENKTRIHIGNRHDYGQQPDISGLG